MAEDAVSLFNCTVDPSNGPLSISRENFSGNNKADFYLMVMKMIFSDIKGIMASMAQSSGSVTEEDLRRLEALDTEIDFLTDATKYLQLLHDAFEPMKDLLESSAAGDVQEAVAFFVAAYQFDLDGAAEGTLGEQALLPSARCRWVI